MYFAGKTPLIQIQSWIARQYTAIGDQARGYDVELRPHKQIRSNQRQHCGYYSGRHCINKGVLDRIPEAIVF